MYTIINSDDFVQAFIDGGRKDNFSKEALNALFEYLVDSEQGTGNELDVVALCCEFSEHSYDEITAEYSCIFNEDEEYTNEEIREVLSNHTQVIEVNSQMIVIVDF